MIKWRSSRKEEDPQVNVREKKWRCCQMVGILNICNIFGISYSHIMRSKTTISYFFFRKLEIISVYIAQLPQNSLCRWNWPGLQRDPPATAFLMLGLKACVMTLSSTTYYFKFKFKKSLLGNSHSNSENNSLLSTTWIDCLPNKWQFNEIRSLYFQLLIPYQKLIWKHKF